MNFKQFLDFVEIKTKLASILPFIFGTLYSLYTYEHFYVSRFILFFISLLFIDMTTTAINNYVDFQKSHLKIYKDNENVLGIQGLSLKLCRNIIFAMLGVASVSGFLLFLHTDLILLIIGAISFIVGITYTFGPTPISRTPYGEVVSSFFMGFVILFLAIYIHNISLVDLGFQNGYLFFTAKVKDVIYIFIASIPFVMCIFNLMLANNICDLERDIQHNRLTLPYYIGKEKALMLYNFNYYVIYLVSIIAMVLEIIPISMIVFLFSLIIVHKNIMAFNMEQIKSKTFILSVKNLLVVSLFYIICMLIPVITLR